MEYVAAIISALGTIIAAFLAYFQYSKNKMTDLKVKEYKQALEEKVKQDRHNISLIYGTMWQTLLGLNARRVYIIQPHPLASNLYLSIGLEVDQDDVKQIKKSVQRLPVCNVAAFAAELCQRDFLYYKDIEHNIKDNRARALFTCNGSKSVIIKRLSDDNHEWIGSLCCEFASDTSVNIDYIKSELADVANKIQYILPEYK